MNKFESYSGCLTWFMALLLVALAAGCGGGGGGDPISGGSGATPALAPTVTATAPPAATPIVTGVAINSQITATFSKDMAPATIGTSTFTLACPAGTAVAGTVAYVAASRVATFSPTANLPASTTCTATITTGAQDTTDIPLASNFVWTFTTGATADTTRPAVTLTVPAASATDVATNTAITATFSEDMDPATIVTPATSFTLTGPGATAVAGDVTYAVGARTATFTPTTPATLPASALFTATITTGATDLAGNTLASNFVWTFTTGAAPDTTAPTLTSTNPANGATGVCINHTVNTTFGEAMDPLTITTATFTVQKPDSSLVAGTVSYNATSFVATFVPTANLAINTAYTVTMTTGVKDVAGNALASNNVWTFTTGITTCTTAPSLGSAQNFAVIAAAAISNAAYATAITGDMGLSPNGLTSITGFIGGGTPATPGTVNGTIYTGDATSIAGLARADAGTAYQAAKTAAAAPGFVTVSGNIGGTTKFPGVYHSTSSISIEGAALTLDAQGDANAVWIFDMESTLTTTPGGTVVLAGGAQAKNVFWRVGSSATLGAAIFKGTILADTSITLGTTAIDVAGRLLAGSVTTSGAVSFNDAAHIVVTPAP